MKKTQKSDLWVLAFTPVVDICKVILQTLAKY
jgi:hypothetical protein